MIDDTEQSGQKPALAAGLLSPPSGRLNVDLKAFEESAVCFLDSVQRDEECRRQLVEAGEQLLTVAHRLGDRIGIWRIKLHVDMLRCDHRWAIPKISTLQSLHLVLGPVVSVGLLVFAPTLLVFGWAITPQLVVSPLLPFVELVALVAYLFIFLCYIATWGWPIMDTEKQVHPALLTATSQPGEDGASDGYYKGRSVWIRFYSSLMETYSLLRTGPDSSRFRIVMAMPSAAAFDLRIFKESVADQFGPTLVTWLPVNLPNQYEQYNIGGVQIQSDTPEAVTDWMEKNREPFLALLVLFSNSLVDSLELRARYIEIRSYNETALTASRRDNTITILDSFSALADSFEVNHENELLSKI